MHSKSGTLEAKPPFDFEKSLRFIEGFRPMVGEEQVSKGMLTKAVMVDGRTVVFRVSAREDARLYCELFSDTPLTDEFAKKVSERVSFFLSLEDDLSPFYSIAKKDAKFLPIVKKLVGLHQVKFPSLFEITCWAIMSQRSRMPVTKKAKDALTERFGGSLKLEGHTYRAFPDHQTLKTASVKDLLAATRNSRSAERLSVLLSNFDELDEHFLLTAPYDKAEERLRRLKGIGEWSAEFILFRGLGRIRKLRYETGPVEEIMREVYGEGTTLDEINQTYGEWSGYWSLYLRASTMEARRPTS